MGLGDLHLSQEVPKEEELELTNGTTIRSALELLQELQRLDKEHYKHHVSENHNDFADWIEEQYNNEELVTTLRKTTTQKKHLQQLEKALLKEIQEYTKKEKKKKEQQKIKQPKKKKDILQQLAHG